MKDPSRRTVRWPTAVGLVVALAGPAALAAISPRAVGDDPSLRLQILLQAVFCGLAVFVFAVVLRCERLPLLSIGLRRPGFSTVVTALLLFLTGFVLLPLVTGPLVRAWGQQGADAGTAELAVLPVWFRLVLGATGGIVEETLYRGYAVERLATITGHRWLGATIATLAFGAAHIPAWGLGFALVADLPAGIILVLFYLWRRDLIANMLGHSGGLIVAMVTIVPQAA